MTIYIIAALQFGTVFVLAAVFWARSLIEHLKRMRAAPEPRRISLRPTASRVPAP
jgi:hypothetical protein